MAGQLFSRATINFAVNTQNALQQITGFQRNFSTSIGQMKTALMGFVGYQGIKGAYNSLTQMVDTAEKLNLPVEKVSEWANLFSVFGGSTEEATQSLEKFDKLSRDLRFHSSGPLRELSAILRTNLNNKDFDGLINSFRSQWGKLDSAAQREVMDMLGVDSAALRRIIGASGADLAKAKEEASRMHKVTKDEADSILQMEKNLAQLKQTLTMTAIPILNAFQPILQVIRDIAMAFNDLDESTQKSIVYGFLGYEVVKHLGLLKTGLTGVSGALAGLGNLAILGTLVAFGPGLWDAAQKLYEVAKGTKTLTEAMDELAKRDDIFGGVIRQFQELGNVAGNVFTKFGVLWSELKLSAGFGNASDAAKVLADAKKGLDAGAISQEEYSRIEAKMKAKMTGNIPRLPKNQGFIPYANPYQAGMTYKGVTGDVIQNINIYGVTGAEDMIDQFRTVAEQSITPLMGGQG